MIKVLGRKINWYKAIPLTDSCIFFLTICLPACLASFSLVAMILLLFGKFNILYLALVGIASFLLTCRVIFKVTPQEFKNNTKSDRTWSLLFIAFVCIWGIININFSSKSVLVTRDPAIYANTGVWLINHENLNIKTPEKPKGSDQLFSNGSGFGIYESSPGRILPQGQRLLPIFIGFVGKFTSRDFALKVNVLFGCTALLAIYGFSRLISKTKWAFLMSIALGLSLPMIYFSRDTYSELLLSTFVFGAMSLIWISHKTLGYKLWFLSGLTAGAGMLARIDGTLILIAFSAYLLTDLYYYKANKKLSISEYLVVLGGMLIGYILGWLDLVVLGNNYQSVTRQKMLTVFIIINVIGFALYFIPWSKIKFRFNKKITQIFPKILLVLTFLLLVTLVSRPLWYVGHHDKDIALVAGLQKAAGNDVDSSRDYSENTITWIAWYIGPLVTILGGLGFIIALSKVISKREFRLLLPLFAIGLSGLVFLLKPSITPDQIWATRRLLPVVIPGVAIFAAIGMQYALNKLQKLKHPRAGEIILSVLVLLPILYITKPFLAVESKNGQLAQFEILCSVIPKDSIVVWAGKGAESAVQPTRSFCNHHNTFRSSGKSLASLTDLRNSDKQVIIISLDEKISKNDNNDVLLEKLASNTYSSIPSDLYKPPRRVVNKTHTIYIGTLGKDGRVSPLLPK